MSTLAGRSEGYVLVLILGCSIASCAIDNEGTGAGGPAPGGPAAGGSAAAGTSQGVGGIAAAGKAGTTGVGGSNDVGGGGHGLGGTTTGGHPGAGHAGTSGSSGKGAGGTAGSTGGFAGTSSGAGGVAAGAGGEAGGAGGAAGTNTAGQGGTSGSGGSGAAAGAGGTAGSSGMSGAGGVSQAGASGMGGVGGTAGLGGVGGVGGVGGIGGIGGAGGAGMGGMPIVSSLEFYGHGIPNGDRVLVPLLSSVTTLPTPANVGAGDMTVELWIQGNASDNVATQPCVGGVDWFFGHMLFDTNARVDPDQIWGASVGSDGVRFGVRVPGPTDFTLCGKKSVLDGAWHLVSLVRKMDGTMTIFVDGKKDQSASGPQGDVSLPPSFCLPACDTPQGRFLSIGAEKYDLDVTRFPPFVGLLDEIRISSAARYSSDFPLPAKAFVPDASTALLLHLDDGSGTIATDSSGAFGGPSNGTLSEAGSPPSPNWANQSPFP